MRKLFLTSIFLFIAVISFSQETKKDTLKTEEITVVKPYTPKISDAFKVKSNPSIEDAKSNEKEKVNYSIFSFPVASTFTPSKGKAKGIVREPKDRLYSNYISAGFGNYTTPLVEAYFNNGDNKNFDFGVFLKHHSSEGGIKDVLLNDSFADTRIDGYYKQFDRDYTWQINAGVQRKLYNYYGLDETSNFNEDVIEAIDEKQVYKNIYVGGKIDFEDSFFQGATAELINFSDRFNSNEFRLLAKPRVELPISSELINTEVSVDFLSGKFDKSYTFDDELNYSFLNFGLSPNFEVLRENLTVNLGAKLYYASDLDRKTNKFYAYPNVTASYKVDEMFILVAGATGDLIQNTYKNFTEENPYVSPTLTILQTDKQYKAFIGAKGKIASNIGYNFELSHSYEKNKPLFVHNQTKTNGNNQVAYGYEAGNSFGVVYDNIKTLGVLGELTVDVSNEFSVGAVINFYDYSTNEQSEAWNLPSLKGNLNATYQKDTWFAGAKLFFRNETKDFVIPYGLFPQNGTVVTNDSFIDLNLNGGYVFSDRLTAFAKLNNILGNKYDRLVYYKVQPIQFLAGITYKFDL